MTFIDRNLPQKAFEYFELALEQKPGWGLAHAKLAKLLHDRGEFEAALPHFAGAVSENPNDARLRNDYGALLYQLNRPNEAFEQLAAAAQIQPDYFRPYINLGNLAFDYGKDALALERFDWALQLAPETPESLLRLARFLATTPADELRDGARAVALAERAVNLTGENSALALDTLGCAYAAAARYDDAIAAASRAQQRAQSVGAHALAEKITERLALYAEQSPFVMQRAVVEAPAADHKPD